MLLPVRLVAGDRSTVTGVRLLFIQQTPAWGSVFAIVFGCFSRIKNARPNWDANSWEDVLSIRTFSDISRDDRARNATCSLRELGLDIWLCPTRSLILRFYMTKYPKMFSYAPFPTRSCRSVAVPAPGRHTAGTRRSRVSLASLQWSEMTNCQRPRPGAEWVKHNNSCAT